jgi:hypothetical protein
LSKVGTSFLRGDYQDQNNNKDEDKAPWRVEMYTIQSRLQRVAWGRIQRAKSNIMAMMLFDGGGGKGGRW